MKENTDRQKYKFIIMLGHELSDFFIENNRADLPTFRVWQDHDLGLIPD